MTDMFRMYDKYSTTIRFKELKEPEETWELLRLIGEGTYGEVYMAKNKHTGEIAAVKILESIHKVIKEIEEEYKILNDFNDHRNMPKFYGLYLKTGLTGRDDQLWIVMEYCSRGSVTDFVKSLLEKGQHIDEPMLAYILKETLTVLSYLHKNHIVHRDIKGHNILLTDKGDIKLTDFGVSGHLKSTLDKKKTSVGTPFWMAPEVIACEGQLKNSYDIRCDIWSLGITCIELIDGDPPLADKPPMKALFRIPRKPPPTMKSPDQWSIECQDFVRRCLAKDYEQRPFAWDLLEHQFLCKAPDDASELKARIIHLTSQTERIIHEPHVTTKQGRLKSHKTHLGPPSTTDDLTKLEVLDDETIVTQLFTRYTQNIIYTYIGDILLAANPFTSLGIYGNEYADKYMHAAKADNPPHIFAIADQAYQMMVHQMKHQCIVISGESGSGKTESANFLVQQLTRLGKASDQDLEERILQVNPLMEAFGNAQTVINDNSSRFGKYLEIFFTKNGTVTGAKITEYLLEKSRVVSQAQGEQNFHIFYYVHDGLPNEDKSHKYHLKENESFRYISEHSGKAQDAVTMSANRAKFKAIMHCFEIIGFRKEEVSSILGIIAAILHTGNIGFVEKTLKKHSGDGVHVSNGGLAESVAKLLGVESKDLVEVLTTTGMVARGEIIIRDNTMHEALDVRDAMSKSLYGRLFSWIVNKINALLEPDKMNKEDSIGIVGLLDIFGFENFPRNSFEQLCINIANEQIQYYFNQHIFEWELKEYEIEGIDSNVIKYVDNRALLDMFLAKPMGLLALLDEESHFPKATDWTLVEKFHKNIKSPFFSRPKTTALLYFTINHYAGQVQYDGTSFLEKNRDRLPVEVVNLLRASDNKVVQALFQTQLTKTGNLEGGSLKNVAVQSLKSQSSSSLAASKGSSSASMIRIQQTVATYFRFSLMDLLTKLVAGTPNFVRCLRPNEANIPDQFNSRKVTIQLKYTGVLETTRIRRDGFSHRVPYAEFVKRYSLLALAQSDHVTPDSHGCDLLLKLVNLNNYALGKTKVFLKFYHAEFLARRCTEIQQRILRIQGCIRTALARKHYYNFRWKMERAIIVLQKYARGWKIRAKCNKILRNRTQSAIIIQKGFRGYLTRKKVIPELQKIKNAAVKLQSIYRGFKGRRLAQQEKIATQNSVLKIQRVFRARKNKNNAKPEEVKKMNYQETAAIKIQSWYRMMKCKYIYKLALKYKEHKELQLIYFGQQVAEYASELQYKLYETNIKAKPMPIPKRSKSSSSVKQKPAAQKPASLSSNPGPSSVPDTPPKKATKSMVTKQPRVPIETPNIDREQKKHHRKMSKNKSVLPETDLHIYSSVKAEETNSDENGESTSSSSLIESLLKVIDNNEDPVYSTVVHRKNHLHLGEMEENTANQPLSDCNEQVKYTKQELDLCTHSVSSTTGHDLEINEDLKTDCHEFPAESNIHEFLNTLQEEHNSSAKGSWQNFQKFSSSGHFALHNKSASHDQHMIPVTANDEQGHGLMMPVTTNDIQEHGLLIPVKTYHNPEYNDVSSNFKNLKVRPPTPPLGSKEKAMSVNSVRDQNMSNGYHQTSMEEENDPEKTVSKVKFSLSEPAIIDVTFNKDKVVVTTRQNLSSSPLSVVKFHSLQTKTDMNIDKLLTNIEGSEKPVYDFQRVLRKTGNIDKIVQQPS